MLIIRMEETLKNCGLKFQTKSNNQYSRNGTIVNLRNGTQYLLIGKSKISTTFLKGNIIGMSPQVEVLRLPLQAQSRRQDHARSGRGDGDRLQPLQRLRQRSADLAPR